MEIKKPDNVAYDEKSGKYNASVLPYATNVSGPVIKLDDVVLLKREVSIEYKKPSMPSIKN